MTPPRSRVSVRSGPGSVPSFSPSRFIPFLIGLSVIALFWPSLGGSFQWDDRYLFLTNPRFGPWDLRWMFTTFLMGHYAPFAWLSWTLDAHVWRGAPAGFHLTNVLLHAANAVWVFFLTRRLILAAVAREEGGPRATGTASASSIALDAASAIAALFFAAHPLRVESVAWITERRALLCAFFSLAAVWTDVSARDADGAPSARGRAASFAFFLAALLSKAAAMSLPVVLLVLDVYPFRRSLRDRRVWRERAPFFLAAALFAVLAAAAQRETGAAMSWTDYGPFQRLAQMAYAPVFLLVKTLWPVKLSPLYELRPTFDPAAFPFPFAALAFVLLTGAVFHFRRRFPAVAAAGVCFLVFLAPTSGIFQSGPQIVADRYATFAGIGLAIAAGAGFYNLWVRGGPGDSAAGRLAARAAALLAVVLTSSFAVITWRQQAYWKTSLALWDRATLLDPSSSVARFNRGQALQDLRRWPDALEEYRAALRLHPTMHQAAYNAAWIDQTTGDVRRAERFYRLALWMKPDYIEALNNLGGLLLEQGRPLEAADCFRQAIVLAERQGGAREAWKFHRNLDRALVAAESRPAGPARPGSPR